MWFALQKRSFDKIDIFLGQGQYPRSTKKNWQIKATAGVCEANFHQVTNLLSLEQSHHKPMGMHGGGHRGHTDGVVPMIQGLLAWWR